jgi:parallel beta-helix repeat protein
MRKLVARLMLLLVITSVLALAFETRIARADGTVYINADGSISPSTAPVSTLDNITYTLTGNINESIVVERSNILLDGAGHTVQGSGSDSGIDVESVVNMTVENANIIGFLTGVFLYNSSDIMLSNNNMSGNGEYGVYVQISSNDTLIGNDVAGNYEGIILDSSSNNTLQANTVEGDLLLGIGLYSSSNSTLIGNDVTGISGLGGVGIYLSSSPYNTLYGNNVTSSYDGVDLASSGGCVLSQNVINGSFRSNFAILGSSPVSGWPLSDYINWVDASNLVDGKPIIYIVNQNGLLIDQSTYPSVGYLALVNCTSTTVKNITLSDNNEQSLLLAYTTNCTIAQSDIINENWGIYVYSSSNDTLAENNVVGATQYTEGAIVIYSSSSIIVSDNNITGNGGDGILVEYSSGNTVSDNKVVKNPGGIGFSFALNNTLSGNLVSGSVSWGMWIADSSGNIVSGNTITQNNFQGIILESCFNDTASENNVSGNYGDGIYVYEGCSNETVSGNTVSGNSADGIGVDTCANITVSGNNVTGNAESGVALYSSSGSNVSGNSAVGNGCGISLTTSLNNTIYHNNMINNVKQAAISGSEPNTWDEGYPSGGNYWSDYNGKDLYSGPYQNVTGSDGIGDTPYVIDANNTDHYPLMNPYTSSSLSVAKTVVGQGFTVRVYFAGANYNNYPRTFNVTVYANTTVIGTQTVNNISNGTSPTLSFIWNTAGFAYGSYTVWASAANDNCTAGNVIVTIPGDINGDGIVNKLDAVMLSNAFLSTPSSSNWNVNADINGDGIVDIYDAIILAAHFGQSIA